MVELEGVEYEEKFDKSLKELQAEASERIKNGEEISLEDLRRECKMTKIYGGALIELIDWTKWNPNACVVN
jgi:hypothetical protein